MVSLLFQMAIQNTMCWCPKNQLDLFYQLDFIGLYLVRIDSMCFYQLHFIQVRMDSMCFINSISRGSTRFQAAGGKGEFRGRLDIEAILLQQRRALGSDKGH